MFEFFEKIHMLVYVERKFSKNTAKFKKSIFSVYQKMLPYEECAFFCIGIPGESGNWI